MHAGYSSPVLNLQLCQTIPSLMLGFHIFPVSADSQNVLYILCLLVLSPLSYEIAPRAWGEGEKGTQKKQKCLQLVWWDLHWARSGYTKG